MDRTDRAQFALLVLSNAFVGAMVGLERSVLPLLAEREFGIASASAVLAFVASFGLAKASTNLVAGKLADRHGRRSVLVAGWLLAIPVPLALLFADRWAWVVAANVLLGVNQGLTWSMTLNMKIDLAGPARRGVATGLNEAAGYGGVALAAWASAAVAAERGLRAPFWLGLAVALVGLALAFLARDTGRHVAREARAPALGLREAFRRSAGGDRRLTAMSAAGLATNLKDGVLWGLLPVVVLARGFDLVAVGLVAAVYPLVWGLGQVATGPASDRLGRRGMVAAGLALQAAGVAALALAGTLTHLLAAAVATGLGTALAYPVLLAWVGDVADASWRASALGAYRFWRDLGYFVGAVGAGLAASAFGPAAAVGAAAVVLLVAAAWTALA